MANFYYLHSKTIIILYFVLLGKSIIVSKELNHNDNANDDTNNNNKNNINNKVNVNELTEAANDEEALPAEDAAVSHLIDRHLFHFSDWSASNGNYSDNMDRLLLKNCSYVYNDTFCDCDPISRRFACYNIQTVDDIRQAFDHLLNVTRLIYWNVLEIHCIEPFSNDEPTDSKQSTMPPNRSFHISYEMFTEGPRFESILFVGDCSKPKHYDNLITVDRDVQRIAMHRNMLRMSTSCSLLQPKFERLDELILKNCLVAGDMISSTFSTRCLGKF